MAPKVKQIQKPPETDAQSGNGGKSPWDQRTALKELEAFQKPHRFGSKAHIHQLQNHVIGLHKKCIELGAIGLDEKIRRLRDEYDRAGQERMWALWPDESQFKALLIRFVPGVTAQEYDAFIATLRPGANWYKAVLVKFIPGMTDEKYEAFMQERGCR